LGGAAFFAIHRKLGPGGSTGTWEKQFATGAKNLADESPLKFHVVLQGCFRLKTLEWLVLEKNRLFGILSFAEQLALDFCLIHQLISV